MNLKIRRILISICICLILISIAYLVNRAMDIPDYIVLWASGNAILNGFNPYDNAIWSLFVNEIDWKFFYPLPTGIFFVPFGAISYRLSYTLWMFLSEILIISSVLILLSFWEHRGSSQFLIPVFAGLIVFRPVLVSIRNGQIGGLLLFILTISLLFLKKKKVISAGVVISLELLKPTIGFPLLFGYAVINLINRQWKALIGLFLGSVAFLGSGFLLDVDWIQKFINVGNEKLESTFGYSPTMWGVASLICRSNNQCAWSFGLVLVVIILVAAIWLLWRYQPGHFATISMLATIPLLISPYAWAYEQVLLVIPIIFIIYRVQQLRWPFLVRGLTFPLISLFSILLLLIAGALGHDILSFILPFCCFLGVSLLLRNNQIEKNEPAS